MRHYFFEELFQALIYIMFIVCVPAVSLVLQLTSNSSALYLSFLVAGFAMTYDYLSLFHQSVGKRLWREALCAAICSCVMVILSFIRLSITFETNLNINSPQYGIIDYAMFIPMITMLGINVLEFFYFCKKQYASNFNQPGLEQVRSSACQSGNISDAGCRV